MIIRNKFIPFKNYKLITIFPFIFTRTNTIITETDIRHETIHLKQQLELLIVLFYIVYILEYCIKLCIYRNHNITYRNISFEREAYNNDNNINYINNRKFMNWIKYL